MVGEVSNVIKLNADSLTPQDILNTVSKRDDIEQIYVIIKTDKRKHVCYGSGNLSGLSDAALYINGLATQMVRQTEEEPEDDE